MIIQRKTILFDIEANDLLPSVSRIHCGVTLDLNTPTLKEFGPSEIPELIEELKTAEVLAGHNICGYDLPVLEKLYGYDVTGSGQKYLDTMAMSRAVYPGSQAKSVLLEKDIIANVLPPKLRGRYSLKAWSLRLKMGDEGKADYDGGLEKWSPEMQAYCVRDVKATAILLKHLLSKNWPESVHHVESMMTYLLYRQEQYGVGFDEEAAINLVADLKQTRTDLTRSLQAVFKPITVPDGPRKQWKKTMVCRKFKVGEDGWVPDRIKGEWYQKTKTIEFNPASTQQMAKRLITLHGWKPQAFTEKGRVQVTDAILRDLPWPEAQKCADYQVVKKTLAYLSEGKNAWLKLVKNGRLHGRVMATGSVTNRATHSTPNLAQVPKVDKAFGKECRSLFVAGGGVVPANYKLIGCDASSLQLSIYAHYVARYDGGALAALCEDENGDPHEFMRKASGLYYRENQKTLTYATWFGAQHRKQGTIVLDDWRQAHDNGLTKKPVPALSKATSLGKAVDTKMRRNMKGFVEITKSCTKDASRGYVTALDGRHIPVQQTRLALLTLLQGNEAVVMKNAYVLACEKLREEINNRLAHPMLWVHDEFQWACEPDQADVVGQALSECITEAGSKLGLRLKLGAKYKIGDTWAQTH